MRDALAATPLGHYSQMDQPTLPASWLGFDTQAAASTTANAAIAQRLRTYEQHGGALGQHQRQVQVAHLRAAAVKGAHRVDGSALRGLPGGAHSSSCPSLGQHLSAESIHRAVPQADTVTNTQAAHMWAP